MRALLRRVDDGLARIEDGFVLFAHGAIAGLVLLAVVFRYAFNDPLTWGEELVVGLFTWMVFIGAAAALRTRTHIRIDVLAPLYRRPRMAWLGGLTLLVGVAILLAAIVACWDQVAQESGVESPMLGISKGWFVASMPVGLGLMLVHALRIWMDEGAAAVFRGETETLVEQAAAIDR